MMSVNASFTGLTVGVLPSGAFNDARRNPLDLVRWGGVELITDHTSLQKVD